MMPQISKFSLSSDVPYIELEAFVVDLLNIEANSRHRVNSLIEFHLVENGGFSSIVESEHEDLSFHVGEGVEKLGDELTHVFS